MGSAPQPWKWIWPDVGPTPVNQGLDSEMFDSTEFPYTETFVREALQNSLDARLNDTEPVLVRFNFHSGDISRRRAFLHHVVEFRRAAELEIPDEWANGNVRWLVVEDFNSRGLSGSLESRFSDFWGYWLNFGISNKDGSGRGGRGIGRVTFLIASRLQSVIGYTRRADDESHAVCGMAVLVAKPEGDKLKSTHAYMAKDLKKDIYALHDSQEFRNEIQKAFKFNGYDSGYRSGLGIAVIYPHKELHPAGILAATIENFAPAIISGDLVIEVDGRKLDASSIEKIAQDDDVVSELRDEGIRSDVTRYLRLVGLATNAKSSQCIELQSPTTADLREQRETACIKNLRDEIEAGAAVFDIGFPLRHGGNVTNVRLRAVVGASSSRRKPIDRLFREGMSLPEVRSRNPGELDLVTLVDDGLLAKYLNFCEGKAHLNLLESKDVLQKLKDHGFGDGWTVKRLVRNLPIELRQLLQPDVTAPNPQVFDRYFAKPKKTGSGGNGRPGPVDLANRNTLQFEVTQMNRNGVRIKANPKFTKWPVNATITLAYADGSSRPRWSCYDFELEDLRSTHVGCDISLSENMVQATNCGKDTDIRIVGFDQNREVDARIEIKTPENA